MNMHLMYICAGSNAALARLLYRDFFPTENLPSQLLFTTVHDQLVKFILLLLSHRFQYVDIDSDED